MTREDLHWLAARGVPCTVTVHGGCMAPTLRDGDRIAVAALTRPARRGDLVLIHHAGHLQLHRVVFVSRSRVGHQGDAVRRPMLTSADAVVALATTFADGRAIPQASARVRLRTHLSRMWCMAHATALGVASVPRLPIDRGSQSAHPTYASMASASSADGADVSLRATPST